ncbi:hypothetical protein N493_19350 (plasmid) [Clostridium botulinum B2 433]|uniref:Lipoprotein n=1 Tax=Clostridium botulinum TaxID=1491 RepID=A0A077K2L5_CLOBO|nr:hypothetical protein [Clostridium botulinum]KEI84055.1 hypothetical protein N493_19350 [Clostridium botulinum B2 433]BAP25732.1 hypothetical protein [Clostridium botulinum]
MCLKNNKGSGLSFLLFGCFLIVFMVISNINILNAEIYNYEKNKKEHIIESSIDLFKNNQTNMALELLNKNSIKIDTAIMVMKNKQNFNVKSLNNNSINETNINIAQLHNIIKLQTDNKINKKLDTFIKSNDTKMYITISEFKASFNKPENDMEIIYCKKYER